MGIKIRYVAEAIIINNKKEFLLQKKSLDYPFIPNSGHWSLFGGGIEKGEIPEEAIRRELKEELGINFENFKLIKSKKFNHPIGKINILSYIFLVQLNRPLSELSILEGAGIAFFDKSELENIKLDPITKETLIEFLKDNIN